ncbi:MAG TPA: MBOAT family O-acyltransferase [Ohtaekwangia sp.]
MLFNSLEFAIFFPVVTILYFLLPVKYRWVLLFVASCIFYCFFIPVYILILFLTIGIDYLAGIWIENAIDQKSKKFLLLLSIVSNVGVLAFFKYYNFFVDSINAFSVPFFQHEIPLLGIILPIGLSFHTFQAMSYTIEVYRGNFKAERHLGYYALYVMYYPQLVAGPIERPQNVLPQLRLAHGFDYDRIRSGLLLMVIGLFKKVVIADRLGEVVDRVFKNPQDFEGATILISLVFFSIQIYCDFSGYSDIAIGASRVMGISLMKNFNAPYLSKSIEEFWSRWHISLSTWFRDYLYIPLGGNRVKVPRWYLNLTIVFLVSGLWHGANWTFVVWGGLHAFYLIVGLITKPWRIHVLNRLQINSQHYFYRAINIAFTFSLVTFAWVFFRSDSLNEASLIIRQVGHKFLTGSIARNLELAGLSISRLVLCLSLIAGLIGSEYLVSRYKLDESFFKSRALLRWSFYLFIFVMIFFFGVAGKEQFIYFQF